MPNARFACHANAAFAGFDCQRMWQQRPNIMPLTQLICLRFSDSPMKKEVETTDVQCSHSFCLSLAPVKQAGKTWCETEWGTFSRFMRFDNTVITSGNVTKLPHFKSAR